MVDYKSHQEELESMLEGHVFFPNMLEFYDNVTYNMRLYLLSYEAQQKLAYERVFNTDIEYEIDDNEKIIIAETGVSSRYSIDSLKIEAIHSSLGQNFKPTSYSLNMVIKEVDGCSLPNKIAVISKILGYESYIQQPYHIDIWFSGYRNDNGKPVKKIGNQILTYEVIMNDVKSNVELSGTTYNFSMTCNPLAAMNKEVCTMFDIGLIKVESDVRLRSFANKIEELINDKYCTSHPEWKHLYEEQPIVKIRDLVNGDYFYDDITDEEKEEIIKSSYSDDSSDKSESLYGYSTSIINRINKNQTKISDYSQKKSQSMTRIDDREAILLRMKSFDDIQINKFIPPQTEDVTTGAYITPNTIVSLDKFFQDICSQSDDLKDRAAKLTYSLENIGNIGGKEHYRVYVDISFTSIPIFKYYIEHSKERQKNNGQILNEDKLKILRFDTQKKEIENILKQGTLNKLYEWQWNGTNTSVLEVDTKLDKLWYANIGYVNADNIMSTTKDTPLITSNIDDLTHIQETIKKLKNEKLSDVIKKANLPYAGIRKLASDKRLYIDDFYNVISDETKANFLCSRNVLEQNTTLTDSNNESSSEVRDLDVVSAKVGYNNVFGSGALADINITILGDPFWLGLLGDKLLYNRNNSLQYVKLQKFGFAMKTTLPQKSNGDGTYNLEECVDFSNIFELVESTHLFENGKFIQKLHGIIDPNLIHLARLKFKNPKR